jgi:predicted homoserine dehydrogenase-like protein
MECKSASGITNLIATKSEEDGGKISFEVSSDIEEGNLYIVLVKRGDEKDEIIYEFITGKKDSYELTANEFGIYCIRAGLESFKGEIIVSRDFSDGSN